MASSFASVHFLNTDKINEDFVNLLKPHIQPQIVLKFLNLPDPEILGVVSNNVFSLFSEEFSIESVNEIVCKCYKDIEMPLIVTGGVFDGDVISLSIIKNGSVVSNITIKTKSDYGDVYAEFPTKYENVELFEELFGVSSQSLKESVVDDMVDTLDNWAELINVPFNHSYYSAKVECENKNFKDFKNFVVNSQTDSAKIIKLEEITKLFLDNFQ